jgi:hypothetical protein
MPLVLEREFGLRSPTVSKQKTRAIVVHPGWMDGRWREFVCCEKSCVAWEKGINVTLKIRQTAGIIF